jgi:hypothetical protein
MHTVAYIFKRVPGMSQADFREYYEKKHGPLMVELMKPHGLVSYDHYPVRDIHPLDMYVNEGGPEFDAISIYSFETPEGAAASWVLPQVVEDSRNFIDFNSMITLPLTQRRVFP